MPAAALHDMPAYDGLSWLKLHYTLHDIAWLRMPCPHETRRAGQFGRSKTELMFHQASAPDLWDGNSFKGVHHKHARYEIAGSGRQVARQVVDATLDLVEQIGHICIIKWQASAQHGIQNDTTAPDISLWTARQLAKDDLYSHRIMRPHEQLTVCTLGWFLEC